MENLWTSDQMNDRIMNVGLLNHWDWEKEKHLAAISQSNYHNYLLGCHLRYSADHIPKTSILVNGQIRNIQLFKRWIEHISHIAPIYVYTDKASYQKVPPKDQERIQNCLAGLLFSEDSDDYQSLTTHPKFSNNMHQWLKLSKAIQNWEASWKNLKISTILRMRSDICLLNPFQLEAEIKSGFKNRVNTNTILCRSDIIFAFDISHCYLMKTFVDNIFKYYLNDDWIQYPFHPINPDLVLKSRGGSRIEWCDYPLYYLSHNTDFYAFFESIARHRDIILNDYHQCANYIDQIDAQTRRSMFGNKLRTTRSQKSDIFTSERTFAHYLLKNEIVASDHNSLFSGFIMRD